MDVDRLSQGKDNTKRKKKVRCNESIAEAAHSVMVRREEGSVLLPPAVYRKIIAG